MHKFYFYILFLFLFTGCDINDFIPKEPDSAEFKEKALNMKHKKELAELDSKKELAAIESEKMVELKKLHKDIRIKEVELQNTQELEKLKLEIQINAAQHDYDTKRNMLFLATILLIVAAYGLYVLFKRRHDKKLQAYNDNLKKYFYQKENESRMRLAEKIVDTIATGKASPDQEAKLINMMQGNNSEPQKPYPEDDEFIEAIDTKEV